MKIGMQKMLQMLCRMRTRPTRVWNFGAVFLMFLQPFAGGPSVLVSWDANRESDLAGYKVYYGAESGRYDNDVFVGNVTSHQLTGLEAGRRYFIAVTALDDSGNESSFSGEVNVIAPESGGGDHDPTDSTLDDSRVLGAVVYNYPNPFNLNDEITHIRYELLGAAEVTIEILDANSNLVRKLLLGVFRAAGEHTEDTWDGRNANGDLVANGIYFCSIRTGAEHRIAKIAVTR